VPTAFPSPTPTATPDTSGKSFTFKCDHSMKRGFFGFERLNMKVGDTAEVHPFVMSQLVLLQ
ncbi:MAG: hypothetical protein ACUZ8E_07965, partial [Candidatus Anammoxibacter sp.]